MSNGLFIHIHLSIPSADFANQFDGVIAIIISCVTVMYSIDGTVPLQEPCP